MNKSTLTLGSLFSGSGGFELGGAIAGIVPVWNSEIEPFAIAVTQKRFPDVKHYGDVSKINGSEIEPVDIITFGSPCQDMSIAGKRAGLEGKRSNLFYEAIRIVKEMRCATNGKYPRYIVWENVPGAFSSNKGEDFRAVLESVCSVKDENVHIPRHEKWTAAGEIVADDYSVAWRVLDAQYWGVPQRRKRIFLVADFDGECAGKILFESESVSGYSAESFRTWQGTAFTAQNNSGTAGKLCLNDQGGNRMDVTEDMTSTLRAKSNHPPCVMKSAGFCTEHSKNSRSIGYESEKSPTLRAGTVPAAMMFENHSQDTRYTGPVDTAQTVLSTFGTGGNNQPFVVNTYDVRFTSEGTRNARQNVYPTDTARTLDTGGNSPDANQGGVAIVALEGNGARPSHHGDGYKESEVMYTLNTTEQHGVAYGIDRAAFNQGKNAKFGITIDEEVEPPMVVRGAGAVAYSFYPQMKSGLQCFCEEKSNTLVNGTNPGFQNGVVAPTFCTSKNSHHTIAEEELANTLVASDYKDPPMINDTDSRAEYIVRRLTPTECARLQGFPDWWCSGLEIENPNGYDIAFWRGVFETYRKAVTKASKPKTDKQIIKWLKTPHSDSAEYKLWGNGVCNVINLKQLWNGR